MARREEIPQVRLLGVNEFIRTVRTAHLHRTTKHIAQHVASYADYVTGRQVFPGERFVAEALGLTDRCVREHLKILREKKILVRVRHNSGRWRVYDEYWLSWPLDEDAIPNRLTAKPEDLEPIRLPRKRKPAPAEAP